MAISAPRSVDRPVSELSDPIKPTFTSADAVVVISAAITPADSSLNLFITPFSSLVRTI